MNSKNHIGAAGELLVCAFFLEQGLEVFRNVASSGPVDLVVWNPENNKSVCVDVKSHSTVMYRADGALSPSYCPKWVDHIAIVKFFHADKSVSLPEGFWEVLGMETAE